MARTGRPPKVNIEYLINGVDDYLKKSNPPIVAEYAHQHGITRQYIYELAKKDEQLSDAIKKISEAKEVMLEKKALKGQYNASMAIFSLKQLGWKDRQEEKSDDDDMVKQFLEKIVEKG